MQQVWALQSAPLAWLGSLHIPALVQRSASTVPLLCMPDKGTPLWISPTPQVHTAPYHESSACVRSFVPSSGGAAESRTISGTSRVGLWQQAVLRAVVATRKPRVQRCPCTQLLVHLGNSAAHAPVSGGLGLFGENLHQYRASLARVRTGCGDARGSTGVADSTLGSSLSCP